MSAHKQATCKLERAKIQESTNRLPNVRNNNAVAVHPARFSRSTMSKIDAVKEAIRRTG